MWYTGRVKRAVIRLPSELLSRLDQLADRLNAACPGRKFSRASVARIVLTTGLGLLDEEGVATGSMIIEGEPRGRGRRP